jgi:predicted Zn-dependent protease with MMP-like domain
MEAAYTVGGQGRFSKTARMAGGTMAKISDAEFEGAIQDALDAMPDAFLDDLENVVIMAQDEPEDWQLESGDGTMSESGDLLGLYDGINMYDRGDSYGAFGDYPDAITIFKGPHERLSDDKAVVLEEVRKTVVHEIGHYFGMDEERLDAMGYGDPDC